MEKLLIILMLGWSTVSHGQLKKLYDREASYQHFNGVVLIKQSDSIVLKTCYGTTDGKKPVELDTRFDIGSLTKQFTATAILQLVHEGKLKLSDPINGHLDSYASDRWKKVTIHQLLTHTSGIPSLYQTEQGLEVFFPEENEINLEYLIGRFKDAKLLFSPGEEFSYSNSGYILLAAIIDQVSNGTYQDFLLKLFKKYGLENTSFARDANAAEPFYGYRNDLLKRAPNYHMSWFKGAGGVYSTASDLSKWVEVITSSEFLNAKLRKEFLKSHTNSGYGYGWQFAKNHMQHDGGNAGFVSFLSFDPDTKDHVIILTNRSFEEIKMFGKSADYIRELVNKSWDVMSGSEIEILPKLKNGRLAVGSYEVNDTQIVVKKNDTSLLVSAADTYPSRFIFNTSLEGNDAQTLKILEIAKFLEKGKYWSLASHCDGEMKFVMYSGLMSVGMRMMKKQIGKMTEITPYHMEEGHGLLRMKGTEGILDLIVYFNEEDKIQGIFEHGNYNIDKEVEMVAYPIGNNLYYLDGLPYGEKSATLKIMNEEIVFYQLGRSVAGSSK
ncbi:serine hydrolase domain-containing protein [Ekhidna sp.]|uniref:serine hydrolase domain-containing protein n=1 Tax=Ekhidna sp. TaxID=2608089 RepID=UPI003298494F